MTDLIHQFSRWSCHVIKVLLPHPDTRNDTWRETFPMFSPFWNQMKWTFFLGLSLELLVFSSIQIKMQFTLVPHDNTTHASLSHLPCMPVPCAQGYASKRCCGQLWASGSPVQWCTQLPSAHWGVPSKAHRCNFLDTWPAVGGTSWGRRKLHHKEVWRLGDESSSKDYVFWTPTCPGGGVCATASKQKRIWTGELLIFMKCIFCLLRIQWESLNDQEMLSANKKCLMVSA